MTNGIDNYVDLFIGVAKKNYLIYS